MPSLNHTHTLVKYQKRPGYYRCAHPECTYFADRELCVGKKTCCTSCGDEFILDADMARRARPRCLNCAETKQARAHQLAKKVLGAARIFERMDEGE